jgi:hypothetical protein
MRAPSFEEGKYKCKFVKSELRGMFFTKGKRYNTRQNTTQLREQELILSTKLFYKIKNTNIFTYENSTIKFTEIR